MPRSLHLRTLCLALLLAVSTTLAHGAPQKGQPAPEFKVVTTAGKQLSLSSLKGQVVVLDFFATWCPPCRDSIPHLMDLSRRYGKQGLQVVGMSMDEDGEEVVRDFVADKRVTYPVALIGQEIATSYAIRSVPMMYVISKKGLVAERIMGYNETIGHNLEQLIKKLLAE
jgi:peroxiredoxin